MTSVADEEYALYHAACCDYKDEVKRLLAKGVNPTNHKDNIYGFSSIIYAAWNGNIDMLKILVEGGGDINVRDNMGRSALSQAKRNGHTECVEYLKSQMPKKVTQKNKKEITKIINKEKDKFHRKPVVEILYSRIEDSHEVPYSVIRKAEEKNVVEDIDKKIFEVDKQENKIEYDNNECNKNLEDEDKIKEIISSAGVSLLPWLQGKIMLIGSGRAGKSAFAQTLMGKSFSETASTVGIDQLVCEVMHGGFDDESKWREGINNGDKDFESAVADVIIKGIEVPKQTTVSAPVSSSSHHSQSSTSTKSVSTEVTQSYQSSNEIENDNHNQKRIEFSSLEAQKCDADFIYKQISEKKTSTDKSKIKLTIYDFAGQKLFTMFHHFFMTSHGVYCLVFNMEWIISEDERVSQTCIDDIRLWLGAAVMHAWNDETEESAQIVLVGTRKDKISSPRDHERISTLLHKTFSYHQAWPSILTDDEATGADGRASFCFYPVDNTLGHDDPTVLRLAKDIERVIGESVYVNQKKPLSYYKFLDVIQSLGVIHLSLAEATDIAQKCGVLTDDVVPMLTFLHDMGKLMFHNEINLRSNVIIKPIQFFVVPATLVVCKHVPSENDPTLHQLPIHRECMKKMHIQWQQFTNEGVLDHKLLLVLLSDYSSNVQTIINLMLKYGLLVKVQHDSTTSKSDPPLLSYIVPPLLPVIEPSFTCQNISSFYFIFTTNNYLENNFTCVTNNDLQTHGFLPHGLFERIIGKCVSWSQRTSKNNALQNCVLGHSCAILTFGALRFQLKLTLSLSCIEVKVEGSQPRAVMKRLSEIIEDIIKECMNMLQYFVALSCLHNEETFLIPLSRLNSTFEKQSVLRKRNGDSILTADNVHSQYHRWLDVKLQHDKWHVFLSYRWNNFDSPFVSALYDYFSLFKLGSDQPVNVFLDTECLQSGKMFQREFASALKNTTLVILTISEETLRRMVQHNAAEIDNVLVEWLCTIEYFESPQSRVSRVCPIFFGHRDEPFGVTDNLFKSDVCMKLPCIVPTASIAKAKELLRENNISPRSSIDDFTVLSLFQQLKSYLCIYAWDTQRFSTPDVIVSECVVEALVMLKSALQEEEEVHDSNTSNNILNKSNKEIINSSTDGNKSDDDVLLYCQEIWNMLSDPNALVDRNQAEELQIVLDSLGVTDAQYLTYVDDLDEEDILKIKSFLKKIPFKKLQNINNSVRIDLMFDYSKAWEVLCDPHSVADKDQGALQFYLMNLGVFEARDLAFLDEEDKAHIQTSLKKIAVIRFTKNMNTD